MKMKNATLKRLHNPNVSFFCLVAFCVLCFWSNNTLLAKIQNPMPHPSTSQNFRWMQMLMPNPHCHEYSSRAKLEC